MKKLAFVLLLSGTAFITSPLSAMEGNFSFGNDKLSPNPPGSTDKPLYGTPLSLEESRKLQEQEDEATQKK